MFFERLKTIVWIKRSPLCFFVFLGTEKGKFERVDPYEVGELQENKIISEQGIGP